MRQRISYYSDGLKLSGILNTPDNSQGKRFPGVVLVPGFMASFVLFPYTSKCTPSFRVKSFFGSPALLPALWPSRPIEEWGFSSKRKGIHNYAGAAL